MNVAIFCHSLISDWNHGNAHFLRGIVTELQRLGHQVSVFEPRDAWSVQNLLRNEGAGALAEFRHRFLHLQSTRYELETLDLDRTLAAADLVIAHEWNDTRLIHKLGEHRRRNHHYRLLFHDTHHRSISDVETIASYRLETYDGVLAFGDVVRERYLERGWVQRAWTWHEAADTTLFYPQNAEQAEGDLIWIGNWGDEERTARLHEFLLEPVRELGLSACVHGVRYPQKAQQFLAAAGIDYRGWVPNFRVAESFARFRMTVHIPRAPYVKMLPGIPTIRVFEALACGIPLICSPWEDAESLFTPGRDYLVARNGHEMQEQMRMIIQDPDLARTLATRGLQTIRKRHTCAHRVDELLHICRNDLALDVIPSSQNREQIAPDGLPATPDVDSAVASHRLSQREETPV